VSALDWLTAYGILAAVAAFFAGLVLTYAQVDRDRRNAARCLILAPVWPLLLVVILARGLSELWRAADWSKP
jgi:hypothetical protein